MYEPIAAASIARRLTVEPPPRPCPTHLPVPRPRHRRAVVASLRSLTARLLVGLAGRLDPDASAS
jgi:hypothetical protein